VDRDLDIVRSDLERKINVAKREFTFSFQHERLHVRVSFAVFFLTMVFRRRLSWSALRHNQAAVLLAA
jgi:hypothetical protein